MSGLGQHIEYAQNFIAQVDAQHARDVARESAMSSDKTRKNTERLYLVVQAMWELLKDKAGLTDADLDTKVQEIDMRDGRLDGQDSTQTDPLTCRQCGRTILSGQAQCSWCGTQAEGGPFTHAR
ncbi:MAG: hypothetical protein IJ173_02560 [Kiritimatiellae bacterium]|nr:hypothetical protein [Kiritimatiellia bacterium]